LPLGLTAYGIPRSGFHSLAYSIGTAPGSSGRPGARWRESLAHPAAAPDVAASARVWRRSVVPHPLLTEAFRSIPEFTRLAAALPRAGEASLLQGLAGSSP